MTHARAAGRQEEYGLEVWNLRAKDSMLDAQVVPGLGGIVSSLRWQGRELLFRHPFFWDPASTETRGGIPFLFPVCGRLSKDGVVGAYACAKGEYKLPIHGFAMRVPWRVAGEPEAGTLELLLEDSAETRALYPYRFALSLHHAVNADGYTCTLRVQNRSDEPLPYYAGFHPYFLAESPEALSGIMLRYHSRKRFFYDATFTSVTGDAPAPRCPAPVNAPELQDLLCQLGQPEVIAAAPGLGDIVVTAEGFDYLQLYVPQGQPFYCLEPWMAWAGAMNSGPQTVRHLPPGGVDVRTMKICVRPATRSG